MKKKLLNILACLSIILIGAFALVGCGDDPVDPNGVKTEAEFLSKFETDSKITLGANITLEEMVDINKDIEIDLNSYTLTFAGTNDCLFQNNEGKKAIIKNGKIRYTSAIEVTTLNGFIMNYGEMTISKVDIELDNIKADITDNTNAIFNYGQGVLSIKNSKIKMNAKEGPSAYKTVGIFNMGKTCEIKDSVVTVNCESAGSAYAVYNYIHESEESVGTRNLTINNSTINITSKAVNSLTGVFTESYLEGENSANTIIAGNTKINVKRDLEEGSGKKTYALRAKGNARIEGARNATLTIEDKTTCEKVEKGAETIGSYTGVIAN